MFEIPSKRRGNFLLTLPRTLISVPSFAVFTHLFSEIKSFNDNPNLCRHATDMQFPNSLPESTYPGMQTLLRNNFTYGLNFTELFNDIKRYDFPETCCLSIPVAVVLDDFGSVPVLVAFVDDLNDDIVAVKDVGAAEAASV